MSSRRATWAAVGRLSVLLGLGWLLACPAHAQNRGQQALPRQATAAPVSTPAPLAPAKLEEALRLFLKADSVANQQNLQQGGSESQGLVLDQAVSKLGHDFYDQFYSTFEAPMGVADYNIIIIERPSRANSSLVAVSVNDSELLELPLPTRADQMEEVVAAAVEAARGFLLEALSNSRQLESGHRAPPERF
ncbi:CsgE family curli-type amyloid fiber assembly protein [Hymenobacter sp. UYCo722]|uniref:CsgE family curli-type amyloid fiber assembly protein n=1 Tax=Hymenobacter sp. UYCo722 TaxID=3156335 RepID=UPI00339A446F